MAAEDSDTTWIPDTSLLPALERFGGRRGRQAMAVVAAGQLLAPPAHWLWKRWRRREDFTITVPGTDDVYPDLNEWVLERIPQSERLAMVATTVWESHGGNGKYEDSEEPTDLRVQLRYDGSRTQAVTIDGHRMIVKVEREQIPERVSLPENWRAYMEKITFTAKTAAGRDAVVAMIDGLLDAQRSVKRPPALFMPSRWANGWTRRGDLPPRAIDSVVLKAGQRERLVDDLQGFLAAEDEYARTSQPWHRGYLFHGTPGTGKTSVARALANHFDLPTYYLPLGDLDKDADLMQYVSEIKARSVLLLEDIDVYQTATKRSDGGKKASIAAALNSLDGVWTPHGLITVMTTNRIEELDPALVRAGRVDVTEEFSELDVDQATRLAQMFGVSLNGNAERFVGQSPSEMIQEIRA